jgi:hypothetical protein
MKVGKMPEPLSEAEKLLAAGYVIGDLSDEELALVEQLSAQKPDFLQEVEVLQVSFNLLPNTLPQTAPPPSLENKVVTAYAAEVFHAQQLLPQPQRALQWARGVAIAATLISLGLAANNYWLRRQLQFAQSTKADQQRVAAILKQPKSRLVALQGEAGLAARGTLLFTAGQWQEVVLSLGDLPPLPPEQVYRLWLSLANDQVLFCGQFRTDDRGSVFIRLTPPKTPPKGVKAKGIFVTVDRAVNQPQPTGKRVLSGSI